MRTLAGNFFLTADATAGDLDVSVNVVHNASASLDMFWEGTSVADTVPSNTPQSNSYGSAYKGPVPFTFPTGDWDKVVTEIECTGPLGICVDQLPASCVSFKQTGYRNAYMGGTALPSGLLDVHVEGLKSAVDVDRIIQALEDNGQSGGTLFLGEQASGKDLSVLNSRSWDAQIEPEVIHRVDKSKAPHVSLVGDGRDLWPGPGKIVHHADRIRKGSRRPLFPGRCAYNDATALVDVPLHPSFDFGEGDTFTIAMWYQHDSPHDAGCIIGTGHTDGPGWELYHASNRSLTLLWRDYNTVNYRSAGTGTLELSDIGWIHIAARWDGSNMTIWLDGVDAGATETVVGTISDAFKTDQTTMRLFRRPDGNYSKTRTRLYDVRVFNRACTDVEISEMAGMKPGSTNVGPRDALVWFDFEEDPQMEVFLNKGTLGAQCDGTLASATLSTFRDQTTNTVYSYLNEFGYSETTDRISYSGADSWDAGAVSEYVFTGPFRMEYIHGDNASHGEDHIGFTDQNDATYAPSTYNHGRRAGYRITSTSWIAYLNSAMVANGTLASGDRVSVERFEDDTLEYRVNGSLVYSYTTPLPGDRRFTYSNYGGHHAFPVDVSENGVRKTNEELGMYMIGTQASSASGVYGSRHQRAANPRTPSEDILGLPLQFTGQAPLDPTVYTPCVKFEEGISYGTASHEFYSPEKTVSFWFRTDSKPAASNDAFIGHWNGSGNRRCWLVTMEPAGHVRAYKSVDGISSSYTTIETDYADGEWHHCSVVYSTADTPEIYINGKIPRNKTTFGSVAGSLFQSMSQPVEVGRYNSDIARTMDFEMSDVVLHGRALTQAEVVDVMNGDYPDGVLTGWHMSDNDSEFCYDWSGNRNTLTLSGTVSSLRDATQDVSDIAIRNGYAVGTFYDGSSWYNSPARLGSGTDDYFSVQVKIYPVAGAPDFQVILGEDDDTNRRWNLHMSDSAGPSGNFRVSLYGVGEAQHTWQVNDPIVYNQWVTYTVTVDTVADELKIYRNGKLVSSTQVTGSGVPQLPNENARFWVGDYGHANNIGFHGGISQVILEHDAVWLESEVLALDAAGTAEEVKSVRPNAYYIPDGNGTEVRQGVSEFEVTGSPETVTLPANTTEAVSTRPEVWTRYNGTNEYYHRAGLISGPECSGFARIYLDDLAEDSVIFAEWDYNASDRSHAFFIDTAGLLKFIASSDGTLTEFLSYGINAYQQQWISVGFSFNAGVTKLYVNGVEVASSTLTTVNLRGSSAFTIGCSGTNATPASEFDGALANIALQNLVWDADQFALLHADNVVPVNAYYWADGSGTGEATLPDMTRAGTPTSNRIWRPPVVYPAGTPAPGQKRQLFTEADAPVVQKYAVSDFELEHGDRAYELQYGSGLAITNLGSALIGASGDFDASLEFMQTGPVPVTYSSLFSQYTLGVSGRFIFHIKNDGSLYWFINGPGSVAIASAASVIELNRWYTARMTRVGDVFTLYLDGTVVGQQTQAGISVQQKNTMLGTDWADADDFTGRIRNVSVTYSGTTTEMLTEGIALPSGSTLTNVTLNSKPAGAISGNQLFQNSDHTAALYAEPMSAHMADVVSNNKYS